MTEPTISSSEPNHEKPQTDEDTEAPPQSTPGGETDALEEFAENEGSAITDPEDLAETANEVIQATTPHE
jgi:hypothetical protein